ncbi:hypothetical protein OS493_015777 [Desmophyllum pertusum]|uniref:Uncharacterized protein n=1 Tax=Desmophyllum pertusum TaxID=174260 RepID=A0A9W9YCM3_9CNID|nr:hypothetical protein OS493_015777 [Desmophyllum pertusum]
MCAFGDPEAKAIVNEIVEEMAVKRGVKRTVEDLVGEETLGKYVETLRVPDWVLLYFKAKARVFWANVASRYQHHKAWKNRANLIDSTIKRIINNQATDSRSSEKKEHYGENENIRIVIPFKDQKSADNTKKQLAAKLEHVYNPCLQAAKSEAS